MVLLGSSFSNKITVCLLQLSSKCDNKLFRIFFSTLGMKRNPFLEAYSKPIRCISRNRTSRPLGSAKRIGSASMDDIKSINNCEGFGHSGKANGRLQTHDPSSVVCFHPSKFSKIEDDVQKTSSQVINRLDCVPVKFCLICDLLIIPFFCVVLTE